MTSCIVHGTDVITEDVAVAEVLPIKQKEIAENPKRVSIT
jgi:hypothetical protein